MRKGWPMFFAFAKLLQPFERPVELLLLLVGGIFALEALSVIAQVLSFRYLGRRVLLMAPIHHHFEKLGWAESTVVIRFWIVAIMLAMLGLAPLKLR